VLLRDHDRALDLELAEAGDRLTGDDAVLEGPAGGVDVPPEEVPVVVGLTRMRADCQLVHVGLGHRGVERRGVK
jgi:hypothetical protein